MRMNVIRRDDTFFELTFYDVDDNLIDLTDCTVFFTVKKNIADSDDDAIIAKEITEFDDPESGVALLQLTKEETDIDSRAYYFDIQLKNTANQIASSKKGRLMVYDDVTIRTDIDFS